LRHRIDQQRQGHHHQEPLNAAGFFHKQRRDKQQWVFEKSEPTLCLGLRFVAGDHLRIAELLRLDVGPQHTARGMWLGVLDALGI
jgi:hypothetical protein